jgi:benzoylformate decarboxylase
LSIPWDFFLADVPAAPARVTRVGPNFVGDPEQVAAAAELLVLARKPMLVAGDGVGAAGAWVELQRLARLLGAPVYDEPMSSYMNYPNQAYDWQPELPQTQAGLQEIFGVHDLAFLCGYNAQAHVFVFDYAHGPLIPTQVVQVYLHDDQWEIGKNAFADAAILGAIRPTLSALCEAIEAHPALDRAGAENRAAELRGLHSERRRASDEHVQALSARPRDGLPTGDDVAIALARLQAAMPAAMMLADEAISDQDSFHRYCRFESPNSYFNAQGGSLGISMPAAIGMKLGVGSAKTVVNTVGDGTALFYPHSWWTTRKFNLPILYLVTNNREYKTLQLGEQAIEQTYGWQPAGDAWYLRLEQPEISFVALAAAFGIGGALVSTVGELEPALAEGLRVVGSGQPYVLDILTDRSLGPSSAPAASRLRAP